MMNNKSGRIQCEIVESKGTIQVTALWMFSANMRRGDNVISFNSFWFT